MKTLTTILIVILTIILGNFLILKDLWLLQRLFSCLFLGVFSYGVYKILESFDNDN
jgi:hypothetical protein